VVGNRWEIQSVREVDAAPFTIPVDEVEAWCPPVLAGARTGKGEP
jgi:hypothetical protein